ncbi:transmembrane protein 51a [Osmerus mordax]|uniref:transmembrane protein 51a n=1 Tax=Osmerus mordax TaxID=8014 RepID=UPI0035104F90
MRSTDNPPPTAASRPVSTSHNNSNGNSGSQYALCALGVGLLALGVVMIVWSVVPPDPALNGSSGAKPENRSKASTVAFVLVGSGVAMLLLSLCLGMRNRKRELQALQTAQDGAGAGGEAAGEDGETAEERAQRYNVPSYEEAVGSGQYPVRQSNLRHSTSQLPAYDDLDQVDAVQFETEGTEGPPPAAASGPAAVPANRKPGKNSRRLLPLKIRRIKSEKMHMKVTDVSLEGGSIEPLTPPPQYEDKIPPL